MNISELNDLDLTDIGNWPAVGKAAVLVLIMAAVIGAGYYFDTQHMRLQLQQVQGEEQKLLKEFHKRQRVIANLEAYRAQLAEMEKSLASMLRQLPTRTEMPDLLEDISNTGLINGLVFDRFKPESERPQEFYATQPISIRARGTYHQFGAFLSGVSALPRIVTVGNLKIGNGKKGAGNDKDDRETEELVLEASLNTYRYLDEDEES